MIVGSGPAAAGAALACTSERDVEVTIIDVGAQLEEPREEARIRMASQQPSDWNPDDVRTISRSSVAATSRGLPEKRAYGSDFPFRNVGQRDDWTALGNVHSGLVSGAYGGFSNVWGAQIMPFTAASFRDWPISVHEMHRHYASVLERIPYAAESDDLDELFPLLGRASPLPQLSERSAAVLARYARHRGRLNRRGVLLGKARLALDSAGCVRCGLCMTGCPYRLIYSSAHTIDELRSQGRITYHDGLLAVRVEEGADHATVTAKELATGRVHRFTADRIFLACGGLGTTRLVMGSLNLFDRAAEVQESAQFILPFMSARPTASDPRVSRDFTLNQFNMIVRLDASARDVAYFCFYTYNAAFGEALPSLLGGAWAEGIRGQVFRRLSVAFGYLPSWASPRFALRASAVPDRDGLPDVTLEPRGQHSLGNTMLRQIVGRVSASARSLDLWPMLPMLRMAVPGKSYHWGGTFPHSATADGSFRSDELGRVGPWERVHLVDGSVLPSVPATTFTLTVMANAHRIADEALRLAA